MRALVDTNIFVYASYSTFPEYRQARAFLKACLEGTDLWSLSWGVIYEYLSVVTHPGLFKPEVLSLKEAVENVTRFTSSPNVEILQETMEHPHHLDQLSQQSRPPLGGQLHDAHIVLLMHEHDLKTIYTADSDFFRFSGIEVINPFRLKEGAS